jgi:N-acetylglucosaminyl-diphospho-decaprenol L-rhamnosyltransferase
VTRVNYGDGLGVVTVTYSPGETLAPFVDTLAKATTRPVQVILADNGSTDGVPEAPTAASRRWAPRSDGC